MYIECVIFRERERERTIAVELECQIEIDIYIARVVKGGSDWRMFSLLIRLDNVRGKEREEKEGRRGRWAVVVYGR